MLSSRNVVLKIDVQGFEDAVLRCAEKTFCRVPGFRMEPSLRPMYEGQFNWWEMRERLVAHGFELYAMLPGYTDATIGRVIELDGVFFRQPDPSGRNLDATHIISSLFRSRLNAAGRQSCPGTNDTAAGHERDQWQSAWPGRHAISPYQALVRSPTGRIVSVATAHPDR